MSKYARRVDTTHAEVVDAFRACGWTVHQAFRDPKGPDLWVSKAGRTVAVEVKGPKGKLKAHQEAWRQSWHGESAVIRSAEDVRALSTPAGGSGLPANG